MPAVAVVALALLACLASPCRVARADDTSLGATGGTVYPVRSTGVRLDKETVQATCFGSFVEYRVDFRFVNEGAPRTIRLGFPFDYADDREGSSEPPVGFQAWQDGAPLAVRVVPGRPGDGEATDAYFVHAARFPHGATRITVSYLAQYSGSARTRRPGEAWNDPGFGTARWCEYWLHTGATWKGRIGEAVVRYRLAESFVGRGVGLTAAEADDEVRVTSPAGWATPLPRTLQWRFTDFEPVLDDDAEPWGPLSKHDVMVGFGDPRKRAATAARWTWSSVAPSAVSDGAEYDGIEDGDLGSCWAEGVSGPGIGEWVEAVFKRPRHLRELRILPGNNAYLAAFAKYARPKVLKAVFEDGSSTLLRFRDAPTLQRFPVDVTTRTVRLVVDSVYSGTDYQGTCISEVEFGVDEAPGYASFATLLADDGATGRLPAWAGPSAPAPEQPAREAQWQERWDAEAVACGDLIGVDVWHVFPADHAPFKEPATLEDIRARAPSVPLPSEELVGEPTQTNALSSWTYEVRYDSGLDLLVNTDLSHVPTTSVLADLREAVGGGVPYEDGRRLPYDVRSIGRCVVAVARPGVIEEDCICAGESGDVPGQVFWRDGDVSYHLYARADEVAIDELVEVATSLIDPSLLEAAEAAAARERQTARGWLGTVATLAVAAVAIGVVVRRRRATAE